MVPDKARAIRVVDVAVSMRDDIAVRMGWTPFAPAAENPGPDRTRALGGAGESRVWAGAERAAGGRGGGGS